MRSVRLGWKSRLVPKFTLLTSILYFLPRTAKTILKKKTARDPLLPDFLELLDLSPFVFNIKLQKKYSLFILPCLWWNLKITRFSALPSVKGFYLPSISGNIYPLSIQKHYHKNEIYFIRPQKTYPSTQPPSFTFSLIPLLFFFLPLVCPQGTLCQTLC